MFYVFSESVLQKKNAHAVNNEPPEPLSSLSCFKFTFLGAVPNLYLFK